MVAHAFFKLLVPSYCMSCFLGLHSAYGCVEVSQQQGKIQTNGCDVSTDGWKPNLEPSIHVKLHFVCTDWGLQNIVSSWNISLEYICPFLVGILGFHLFSTHWGRAVVPSDCRIRPQRQLQSCSKLEWCMDAQGHTQRCSNSCYLNIKHQEQIFFRQVGKETFGEKIKSEIWRS